MEGVRPLQKEPGAVMGKLAELEQRLLSLEGEFDGLRAQVLASKLVSRRWYAEIAGSFRDDPVFDEIVRLGREYRQSLRPKSLKRKVKK